MKWNTLPHHIVGMEGPISKFRNHLLCFGSHGHLTCVAKQKRGNQHESARSLTSDTTASQLQPYLCGLDCVSRCHYHRQFVVCNKAGTPSHSFKRIFCVFLQPGRRNQSCQRRRRISQHNRVLIRQVKLDLVYGSSPVDFCM